jgi:Zn-dependent protease
MKLGRLLGIDIKMHLTFVLILLWGAFNYGGNAGPLYGLLITVSLFGLVLLHELGHSLAAMAYGITVRDITLLPIGGVARLERMPKNPLQELVVALAGPGVNVLLALLLLPVIFGLALSQEISLSPRALMQPGVLGLLTFLLSANLSLAVFNMIPAFPLDGGRVFRAILGFFVSYERATQIAVITGRVLAVGFGALGLFTGHWMVAAIALLVFMAGGQESKAVAASSLLRRLRVEEALSPHWVTLSPHTTIGQVASIMMNNNQPDFAVLDPLSRRLLGIASSGHVAHAMQEGRWFSRITEIMEHAQHVPTIALNASLDEAQEKLAETSSRVAAVYDGLHFQGLLSIEDIYRAFRFVSQPAV